MSLFKICSWWSVQCPDVLDNYDSSSILCCRLGLDNDEKDYIIVGSHKGHLSIFYPTSEVTEDGSYKGFKPTDLVLETKLKAPILGLACGRFSGAAKNDKVNQLAILHPLSLCIYNITTVDGVAEHGTHSSLQQLTEHKFHNNFAFGFCKGNFGGIKGREFLCVTHMNGNLTLFEQDGISYECILPGDKTIPFNMVYVPRIDSFVRINSCWELECYSYQDISQCASGKSEIIPIWTLCIGEFPLDIITVQVTNQRTAIMILGERNLINISDDGKVQFIKKLDYTPMCFHSFVVGWYWEPNARLLTAVVTDSASLLVYEDAKLIWGAKLEEVPIAIQRSNLHNLPGGIVTLGTTGMVHVGFLGSDPQTFKVPPLNLQEMNFENAQKELIELEKEIKQGIDMTDVNMVNASAERDLDLSIVISQNLEVNTFDVSSEKLLEQERFMCLATVQFTAKINMDQVQITFNMADGLKCSIPIITFNDVLANNSEILDVWIYIDDKVNISTTELEVVASFINKQSIPRVLTRKSFLPLNMFFKVVQPQKDSDIKITLSVVDHGDKSKIYKISAIFPEFCSDAGDVAALGLVPIYGEDIVTVVAAKNTNRFRIQSDALEVIPAVLKIIVDYIHNCEQMFAPEKKEKKSKKQKQSKIKSVIIAPTMPTEQIIERVASHYQIQEDIKTQTALMDALWNQFKLFQRSLQSKVEGEPTDGIMMLIEKNYDDLIKEGDILMIMRETEKLKRCNLSCAIALARHIVSCLNLDDRIVDGILSALVYPVEDWSEKCWEETAAPAFEMLTHYGPLCRNKNAPLDSHPSFAATQFELDRLKRHMTSLLDRVCRLVTDKPRIEIVPPSAKSKKKHTSDEENSTENSNVKSDANMESEQNMKDSLKNGEDDDDDDEGIKARESDWLSGELPAADIVSLRKSSREGLQD